MSYRYPSYLHDSHECSNGSRRANYSYLLPPSRRYPSYLCEPHERSTKPRRADYSHLPPPSRHSNTSSSPKHSYQYDSHDYIPHPESYQPRRAHSHVCDSCSPPPTTYCSPPQSSYSFRSQQDTYYYNPALTPRDVYLIERKNRKQAREEGEMKRREKREQFNVRMAQAAELPKLWLEHVATKRMNEQRYKAAVVIQSHCRGFLQGRSFGRTKHAIIIIQARMRGFLQRRALQIQQRSVLLLQRSVRQWILQRRAVLCPPQWIYYNPLFSMDGVSSYDDEDCEEDSVAKEPLRAVPVQVATLTDLLQRFGQPLLVTTVSDMLIDALEVPVACLRVKHDSAKFGEDRLELDSFDWDPGDTETQTDTLLFTPHIEMIIVSVDLESAAPSLPVTVTHQILSMRPPPKPPKVRNEGNYMSVRPTSEVGLSMLIEDDTERIRPLWKPPWSTRFVGKSSSNRGRMMRSGPHFQSFVQADLIESMIRFHGCVRIAF